MERGAIGELIPESGVEKGFIWGGGALPDSTDVWDFDYKLLATFYGEKAIRLERVALFLTTEQS